MSSTIDRNIAAGSRSAALRGGARPNEGATSGRELLEIQAELGHSKNDFFVESNSLSAYYAAIRAWLKNLS